jgi:hypothetical protein
MDKELKDVYTLHLDANANIGDNVIVVPIDNGTTPGKCFLTLTASTNLVDLLEAEILEITENNNGTLTIGKSYLFGTLAESDTLQKNWALGTPVLMYWNELYYNDIKNAINSLITEKMELESAWSFKKGIVISGDPTPDFDVDGGIRNNNGRLEGRENGKWSALITSGLPLTATPYSTAFYDPGTRWTMTDRLRVRSGALGQQAPAPPVLATTGEVSVKDLMSIWSRENNSKMIVEAKANSFDITGDNIIDFKSATHQLLAGIDVAVIEELDVHSVFGVTDEILIGFKDAEDPFTGTIDFFKNNAALNLTEALVRYYDPTGAITDPVVTNNPKDQLFAVSGFHVGLTMNPTFSSYGGHQPLQTALRAEPGIHMEIVLPTNTAQIDSAVIEAIRTQGTRVTNTATRMYNLGFGVLHERSHMHYIDTDRLDVLATESFTIETGEGTIAAFRANETSFYKPIVSQSYIDLEKHITVGEYAFADHIIGVNDIVKGNPIVFTLTNHGFYNYMQLEVISTDTDLDGSWYVSVIDANTFSLIGSNGSGPATDTPTIFRRPKDGSFRYSASNGFQGWRDGAWQDFDDAAANLPTSTHGYTLRWYDGDWRGTGLLQILDAKIETQRSLYVGGIVALADLHDWEGSQVGMIRYNGDFQGYMEYTVRDEQGNESSEKYWTSLTGGGITIGGADGEMLIFNDAAHNWLSGGSKMLFNFQEQNANNWWRYKVRGHLTHLTGFSVPRIDASNPFADKLPNVIGTGINQHWSKQHPALTEGWDQGDWDAVVNGPAKLLEADGEIEVNWMQIVPGDTDQRPQDTFRVWGQIGIDVVQRNTGTELEPEIETLRFKKYGWLQLNAHDPDNGNSITLPNPAGQNGKMLLVVDDMFSFQQPFTFNLADQKLSTAYEITLTNALKGATLIHGQGLAVGPAAFDPADYTGKIILNDEDNNLIGVGPFDPSRINTQKPLDHCWWMARSEPTPASDEVFIGEDGPDPVVMLLETIQITGAQVVPPTSCHDSAVATFTYREHGAGGGENDDADVLLTINHNLSYILSAAIRAGAPDANGGSDLYNLTPTTSPITHSFTIDDYNALGSNTYIILRSLQFQSGAIRGNIDHEEFDPVGIANDIDDWQEKKDWVFWYGDTDAFRLNRSGDAFTKRDLYIGRSLNLGESIVLPRIHANPMNPKQGTIIYNGDFEGFDGSRWRSMTQRLASPKLPIPIISLGGSVDIGGLQLKVVEQLSSNSIRVTEMDDDPADYLDVGAGVEVQFAATGAVAQQMVTTTNSDVLTLSKTVTVLPTTVTVNDGVTEYDATYFDGWVIGLTTCPVLIRGDILHFADGNRLAVQENYNASGSYVEIKVDYLDVVGTTLAYDSQYGWHYTDAAMLRDQRFHFKRAIVVGPPSYEAPYQGMIALRNGDLQGYIGAGWTSLTQAGISGLPTPTDDGVFLTSLGGSWVVNSHISYARHDELIDAGTVTIKNILKLTEFVDDEMPQELWQRGMLRHRGDLEYYTGRAWISLTDYYGLPGGHLPLPGSNESWAAGSIVSYTPPFAGAPKGLWVKNEMFQAFEGSNPGTPSYSSVTVGGTAYGEGGHTFDITEFNMDTLYITVNGTLPALLDNAVIYFENGAMTTLHGAVTSGANELHIHPVVDIAYAKVMGDLKLNGEIHFLTGGTTGGKVRFTGDDLEVLVNSEWNSLTGKVGLNTALGSRFDTMLLHYSDSNGDSREWVPNSFLQILLNQSLPAEPGENITGCTIKIEGAHTKFVVGEEGEEKYHEIIHGESTWKVTYKLNNGEGENGDNEIIYSLTKPGDGGDVAEAFVISDTGIRAPSADFGNGNVSAGGGYFTTGVEALHFKINEDTEFNANLFKTNGAARFTATQSTSGIDEALVIIGNVTAPELDETVLALKVNGLTEFSNTIKVGDSKSQPISGDGGLIRFHSNDFEGWDGTYWISLTGKQEDLANYFSTGWQDGTVIRFNDETQSWIKDETNRLGAWGFSLHDGWFSAIEDDNKLYMGTVYSGTQITYTVNVDGQYWPTTYKTDRMTLASNLSLYPNGDSEFGHKLTVDDLHITGEVTGIDLSGDNYYQASTGVRASADYKGSVPTQYSDIDEVFQAFAYPQTGSNTVFYTVLLKTAPKDGDTLRLSLINKLLSDPIPNQQYSFSVKIGQGKTKVEGTAISATLQALVEDPTMLVINMPLVAHASRLVTVAISRVNQIQNNYVRDIGILGFEALHING